MTLADRCNGLRDADAAYTQALAKTKRTNANSQNQKFAKLNTAATRNKELKYKTSRASVAQLVRVRDC